jgi:hypothetical protein
MTRVADTAAALQIEERLAGLLERHPLASWSIASLRTLDALTLAALGVILPAGCTAVEITLTLANEDRVRVEARCLYGSES